ncbi:MAG: exopolyphosphatase [Flavobacteriales bacterium]|nr:exopolyphosphatase [Flavobacteriales bacterium]
MPIALKFGAIDIGSNAVRLLITNVFETPEGPLFRKSELIRLPVRLGEDVFSIGHITPDKAQKLVDTMLAFKLLLGVHGVVGYRACATSAMRNATNSEEIVERVADLTGIDIEVIHGRTEADIIFSNHVEEQLHKDRSYLYIDVGGGSTELTLFSDNRPVASRSFRIGTIRLLQGKVEPEYWERLFGWLKEQTESVGKLDGIGSGGNINKIYKIISPRKGGPITYGRLQKLYTALSAMTYEERVMGMGLNLDRADVIIPATEIFLKVMKAANIKDVIVPQFGLSDGMTRLLYEAYREAHGKV